MLQLVDGVFHQALTRRGLEWGEQRNTGRSPVEIPERWAMAIRSAGFSSISALANEAMMSTNQVLAIVSGEMSPDRESRRILAATMGISLDELEELIAKVEEPDPFILPEGSERLTPRQRATVTEMVLTFLEANRAIAELEARGS